MHLSLLGTNTEGWRQIADLAIALALSAAIGVEREIRQKSAGLRTHALVGVGTALFMLISKYGFSDVLIPGKVMLDPSRMAAQIVSGVGFLGAGLIFVRSDAVRGLTTAAAVWVTAAVGTAAGADLPVLAVLTTVMYFLIVLGFPFLTRYLPKSSDGVAVIGVRYLDGRGVLRDVLRIATAQGFSVAEIATSSLPVGPRQSEFRRDGKALKLPAVAPMVQVQLKVLGTGPVSELASALSDIDGVDTVLAGDASTLGD